MRKNHLEIAISLNNIGRCYFKVHRPWALKMYEEALKIRRGALGENHLDVTTILDNIGRYYEFHRNDKALELYGKALEIRRAALGENHRDVAMSLNNIGVCYRYQFNTAKALKLHGEALEIYRVTLEENHPDIATTLYNIGRCYSQLNQNRNSSHPSNCIEALKVHGEALKIRKVALGENHPDIVESLWQIKLCHANLKMSNFVVKLDNCVVS